MRAQQLLVDLFLQEEAPVRNMQCWPTLIYQWCAPGSLYCTHTFWQCLQYLHGPDA